MNNKFKKYNLHVLTSDFKMFATPFIYNGINLEDINYVYNYKVLSIYMPFKLECFYVSLNNKKIRLFTDE